MTELEDTAQNRYAKLAQAGQVKVDARAVIYEVADLEATVDDLEAKADKYKATLSDKVLSIAQDLGELELFLVACADAEAQYKADTGNKVPKHWTQAKSNIKASFKEGLDPREYDSESGLRKAKVEAKKQSRVSEANENERKAQKARDNGPVSKDKETGSLQTTGILKPVGAERSHNESIVTSTGTKNQSQSQDELDAEFERFLSSLQAVDYRSDAEAYEQVLDVLAQAREALEEIKAGQRVGQYMAEAGELPSAGDAQPGDAAAAN